MSRRTLPVIPPEQKSIHRRTPGILHGASDRLSKPPRPTPQNPLILSASELKDFLRCRVKWDWRHNQRLESRQRSPALALGTVVHEILDRFYQLPLKRRGPKAMIKLANEVPIELAAREPLSTEDLELARAMCEGYAHWCQDEDAEIGLVECFPEEWFMLPLVEDGSILIRGKIDNRFESKTLKRTMGLLEMKTAGQFKTDIVDLNLQLSVYLWAMRKKFPKHKHFVAYYTQLRKQMPGPRVKADLFRREMVERTAEELDQWAIDTARAALDMVDAAIYPSPQDTCSWSCDYQNACLMRGNPADLEHVLTTQFKTKEAR